MPEKILNQQQYNGGISVSDKIGIPGSYAFSQNCDIHQDPTRFTLQVAPVKVSGTTVVDLVKWVVRGTPYSTSTYFYGGAGNIYQETSLGVWSNLRTVANSHGQGMCIYQDYLYYVQDQQIGRYGPLSGSPNFTDNWLTGLNNTSATGFAPIVSFTNQLIWGHGNLIGAWDGIVSVTTALNSRITLVPGHNVRNFSTLNEYLVFGTWRSTSGNIYESEEGYLFFWDGISNTYNFFVDVPEGASNAIQNTRNTLLGVMGSTGILYKDALSYTNQFTKLQSFPKLTPSSWVEVYPGAMNNWSGKTYYAPGNSNSSDIVRAVYEWGALNQTFPDVLNCPFTISTGNSGSNVQIGSVQGFGTQLYIGWKDVITGVTTYGVDRVTKGGSLFASGYLDLFFFDNQQVYKDKLTKVVKIIHTPLAVGESVIISYRFNRASSFVTGITHAYTASEDAKLGSMTRLIIPPNVARFNEMQIRITIGGNGSTAPFVFSSGMLFDDLKEEGDY